ncbi:MAG: WecB/TagA/CpsF family glycosyltransferase [Ramlibacter sp.]|nr:WecB/TagA/CpsF family glycosyltransferase [Ramlibacter sp.]
MVSILGLPFDLMDVGQAVQHIRAAAFAGRRCFVSTPNLNFAIAARTDAAFRGSVLRSDLSLIDGMYLVWVARLLGVPVRQRVSGADLSEALRSHAGPSVGVYLFGGPPGSGALAADAINRDGGGVHCVGFDTAGYGSVESMSSNAQIARINSSGAHFVVVSLGASKGQAWIERNAERLTAPVLSHLGAVINFTAGTVRRAPGWLQVSGLEWLWRVSQEPALWRRYASDGATMVGLLATRVLPDAIDGWRWRAFGQRDYSPARLELVTTAEGCELRLYGDWRDESNFPALRDAFKQCALNCASKCAPLRVDMAGVTGVGGGFTGLVLVACGWFARQGGFDIVGATPLVAARLRRQLVAHTLLGVDR